MDKELNEDARTKQDLLYECNSLESRLSNEIVKNEHLEQQCKKQKEVIDKAIEYINSKVISNGEIIDQLRKIEVKELLQILDKAKDSDD